MNSPFILLFDFELDRDSMEPLQFNQFSIQVQFACEYVNWAASLLIWEWIEMRRKQNRINYVLCLWVQFNCPAIHLDAILLPHLKLNTQHIHSITHTNAWYTYYVKNQCETGIGHWHSNRNEFKRLQTLARTYNELNLNEPQSIEPATSNAVVVVHLHFICIWNSRQRSVIFFCCSKDILFFL